MTRRKRRSRRTKSRGSVFIGTGRAETMQPGGQQVQCSDASKFLGSVRMSMGSRDSSLTRGPASASWRLTPIAWRFNADMRSCVHVV